MALDFPPGTPGATYTGPNGVIWSWDGAKWLAGTSASVYAPIASPAFSGNPQVPQPQPGDSDATIPTTKFVTDAVATSLHDVGRNYIHNAMFNIAQRGAGTFASSGTYTADRWRLDYNAPDVMSVVIAQYSDGNRAAIGDEEAINFLNVAATGNAAAGAFSFVGQNIENVRRLAGKTITVSFWASCNTGSPKLGIGIRQYFGTGGSPSAAVDLNGQAVVLTSAGTIPRYTVTFTLPSISGKTLGTNNDHCTRLSFWLSCGATNATMAGNPGVQTYGLALWGVQLELGTVATPLEKLDPVTQLQQCQRFFEASSFSYQGYQVAGIYLSAWMTFAVPKRGNPTIAFSGVSYTNGSGIAALSPTPNGFAVAAIATAQGSMSFYGAYTVSADL